MQIVKNLVPRSNTAVKLQQVKPDSKMISKTGLSDKITAVTTPHHAGKLESNATESKVNNDWKDWFKKTQQTINENIPILSIDTIPKA